MPSKPNSNTRPDIPGALDQNGRDADGMTVMQRKFADCYLDLLAEGGAYGSGIGIKKQAALNAGYSASDASNAAWRNLRLPPVMSYVSSQLAAATAKVPIDRSFVLFKAMIATEIAESNNDPRTMIRCLDTIARHKDVAATMGARLGLPDPDGDGGISANALANLDDEDLKHLIRIKRKLAGGAEPPAGDTSTGTGAAGK